MLPTSPDPLEHLERLKDRIGRLFEVASTRAEFDAGDGSTSGWSPLVDLYETSDEVVLLAEVPGLSMEDLDVQVTDATLTLKGGARPQVAGRNAVHHRVERSHGAFTRSFHLSAAIDRDKVTAEYRQGLLKVVLPKRSSGRPLNIQVKPS